MKKRILVIDDENGVLDVVKRTMERNGYEVYVCATAVKAIEFARKRIPDLIISDFNLSELSNGVDLALSIRYLTKNEIPIIIMSGSLHNRKKVKTNEFEFIEKPFNNMELTELVERSFHSS